MLIKEGRMEREREEKGEWRGREKRREEALDTHSKGLLSWFLEPKAGSAFVLGERCWHFYALISPLLFIQ